MLNVSSAAQTIIQSGVYLIAQCYDFFLANGQTYHFTDFDVPLPGVTVYLPNATTTGPFNYATGLTITRSSIKRTLGVSGGNMKLSIAPQWDSPSAPVLINGYPLLQASMLGFFDNARMRFSRLYMSPPVGTAALDVSPGAIGIFEGQIQDLEAGSLKVDMTVDDYLAMLANQMMPRPLFGPGCWHQVYDAGCTLSKSAFTVTGAVTGVTDAAHFTTNLSQADDYFDLGLLTFTSGVNNGFNQEVREYLNAGGAMAMGIPFPAAPSIGDTFSVFPGCDLQQATCSGKFSNLPHYSGHPYTPDPATVVDGDVAPPPVQPRGSQAGVIIGSSVTSKTTLGQYRI